MDLNSIGDKRETSLATQITLYFDILVLLKVNFRHQNSTDHRAQKNHLLWLQLSRLSLPTKFFWWFGSPLISPDIYITNILPPLICTLVSLPICRDRRLTLCDLACSPGWCAAQIGSALGNSGGLPGLNRALERRKYTFAIRWEIREGE